MKRNWLVAALAAAVFAGGGCIFWPNEYVETADYDIVLATGGTRRIALGVFRNFSGADRRFLCRNKDGRMIPLEYHRWLMSPELMLQRGMYDKFSIDPRNDAAIPRVSCDLYRFEFDDARATARFAAEFCIEHKGEAKVIRVDLSEPVTGEFPGRAGADAMSACIAKALAELDGALKK